MSREAEYAILRTCQRALRSNILWLEEELQPHRWTFRTAGFENDRKARFEADLAEQRKDLEAIEAQLRQA